MKYSNEILALLSVAPGHTHMARASKALASTRLLQGIPACPASDSLPAGSNNVVIGLNEERYFDGTDTGRYDIRQDFAGFEGNEDRTVCTWYRIDPSAVDNYTDIDGTNQGFNLFEFGQYGNDGRFAHGRWKQWTANRWKNAGSDGYVTHTWGNYPDTTGALSWDTDWHHTCVTWDGSERTLKAYHDGNDAGDYDYHENRTPRDLITGQDFAWWGTDDQNFQFKGHQSCLVLMKGTVLTDNQVQSMFQYTAATSSPTTSPTNTPWEITLPNTSSNGVAYQEDNGDVFIDFSGVSVPPGVDPAPEQGTEGYITTKYAAKARAVTNQDASNPTTFGTFMVKGACNAETSLNAAKIDHADEDTCLMSVTDGSAPTFSTQCTYRFEKANFANDYNLAPTGSPNGLPLVTLCEVAQLKLQGPSGPMTIAETFTNVFLEFQTSQSFDTVAVSMSPAEIETSNQSSQLSDYITATNCGASPLPPNTPLCIAISSSSNDVLIESLDTFTMTGPPVNGADGTLDVVDGTTKVTDDPGTAGIKYPAITTVVGVGGQTVTVNSRVPSNMFDFEASGALTIGGSVTLMFASGRRRLTLDLDRALQSNEVPNDAESAAFGATVDLAPEPKLASEDGDVGMMNSAVTKETFATLGMVFTFAFALW